MGARKSMINSGGGVVFGDGKKRRARLFEIHTLRTSDFMPSLTRYYDIFHYPS